MTQTPKIKRTLLVCLILGVLISASFWFFSNSGKSKYSILHANKLSKNAFYVPLAVQLYTEGNIPCFPVEIENNQLLFRLDLGSNGDISILEEYLLNIKDKSFLTAQSSSGINGNIYTIDVYSIPKMNIGPITFSPLKVSRENPQFNEEALLNIKKDPKVPPIAGTIGWRIFNQTALLLDLGSSTIAVCDSIETFKNQGHTLDHFTKAPFLIDRPLIEFETLTSMGPLRCILDTGCTLNFLNSDKVKGHTLSQMIRKDKNYKKISSVTINGTEFGPIEFCKIPIKLPYQPDAILGMEFLTHHVVLIDFPNHQIYFSKK